MMILKNGVSPVPMLNDLGLHFCPSNSEINWFSVVVWVDYDECAYYLQYLLVTYEGM